MSKPRYKWWSYVKWMIRLYPERVAELRRRQEASVTANYNAMPGGSDPARTTETLGLVSLGNPADREMDAVRRAIEDISALPDGSLRLQQIQLYHWARTHTLDGASAAVNVSERTGREWNAEFIRAVAAHFGLLDLHPRAMFPGYNGSVMNCPEEVSAWPETHAMQTAPSGESTAPV